MKLQLSTKRLQISKAQSSMMVVATVAAIITVFCLVSAKALLAEAKFQSHVISAQKAAAKQIQANVQVAQNLSTQYNQVFEGTSPLNLIGGQNDSNPDVVPPNGDNGRIVLDALPTTYDFPALLTSLSNLLSKDGVGTPSIGGTDDSSTANNQPSTNPQVTEIDFTIAGNTSYQSAQTLIKDLERSIRPFKVTKMTMSGSESSLSVAMNVTTYYQPAKTLNLTTKEVH